ELFAERGYEATTAAQIAERADLTKTTLFRHFADKREIVFQGEGALIALAVGAIEAAPGSTPPFELVRAAVVAMCAEDAGPQRETGRRLEPILAASPELRERAVFKRAAITDAVRDALTRRLDDPRLAATLADVGIRAFYDGFTCWTATD